MHRLISRRHIKAARWLFLAITAVLVVFWVARATRSAIDCGLIDDLFRSDLSTAWDCVGSLEYDALITGVTLITSFLTWLAFRQSSPIREHNPTPTENTRSRDIVLKQIQVEIDRQRAILESPYKSPPIGLNIEWYPTNPSTRDPIRLGASASQLFTGAQGRMFILGEPGSGKTKMLLDLAQSILEEANLKEDVPIPVVFNLASFTDIEQSLDEWLVGQFCSICRAPLLTPELAQYWINHNAIAVLLDGLDEVYPIQLRDKVVEKISQYQIAHHAPRFVVCCRTREFASYFARQFVLKGVAVIVLQPLTPSQIETYLANLEGDGPKYLWNVLENDKDLLQLANTPLMLIVMVAAAYELNWHTLPSPKSTADVLSYIYSAYLRSVQQRQRNTRADYAHKKTLRWLQWLAVRMGDHEQKTFFVERMDRSWFNRPWQGYIWVPVCMLIGGLIGYIPEGSILALLVVSAGGLIVGLSDIDVEDKGPGTFVGYGTVLHYGPTEYGPKPIRRALRNGLLILLVLSLIGLILGLFIGSFEISRTMLQIGLVLASINGWIVAVKYYVLRIVLHMAGSMPLDYERFLEDCVDRGFLRRVGGGYEFIHPTFMEYIAALS